VTTTNDIDTELDHYILQEHPEDAKESSPKEIAEAMDVSPSTVRKRIDRLTGKNGWLRRGPSSQGARRENRDCY
jgi:DNA-binding Lrp family transcriptional regulator